MTNRMFTYTIALADSKRRIKEDANGFSRPEPDACSVDEFIPKDRRRRPSASVEHRETFR